MNNKIDDVLCEVCGRKSSCNMVVATCTSLCQAKQQIRKMIEEDMSEARIEAYQDEEQVVVFRGSRR